MQTDPVKKPRFYFRTQKAARWTIFCLFAISAGFMIMTFTSLNSYKTNGYITVHQKSGSFEIHGPDAMTTIYCHVGSAVFFFGLGTYFSVMYILVRNAQKRSSQIIVPEECILQKVICPSCMTKQTICDSSEEICSKCNLQMIDQDSYFSSEDYLKKIKPFDKGFTKAVSGYEKFYKSLYPDFSELSIFLIGFVLCLLLYFNPECRNEILEPYRSFEKNILTGSLLAHVLLLTMGLAVTAAGILASFYHILVTAEKGEEALVTMKLFALITLTFIGLKSGFHVLENQSFILIVSPAWNLITAAVCYAGLGMIDEIPFDQTDSKYWQTFLSLVLIATIFFFLNSVLKLYWPVTFSICINYIICLNKGMINSKFLKLYTIYR